MKNTFRVLLAAFVAALAAPMAHAEGPMTLDRGRFIVFQGDEPVGLERFEYSRSGDSVVVTAVVERRLREADGTEKAFRKLAQIVLGGMDLDLRSYLSTQMFDEHKSVRRVEPADTTLTVYSEVDDAGSADAVVRPPGRVYIMDPLVFSLFDVICRSLSPQSFAKRPIQLLTLGPGNATAEAIVTAAGADTVRWGGKRVISRRFVLTDANSRFTLWMDRDGHMLRLEHDGSGLSVMREEPDAGKPAGPTKTPKRIVKPVPRKS